MHQPDFIGLDLRKPKRKPDQKQCCKGGCKYFLPVVEDEVEMLIDIEQTIKKYANFISEFRKRIRS